MEADNLADLAVQLLTGLVSGAGNGLKQGVTDLVRGRLSQLAEGRAALNRLDAAPADPAAVAGMRDLLIAVLTADPAFRQELERRWAVAFTTAGRDQIGGDRTTIHVGDNMRGHISIGAAPAPANRGTRFALAGAALVAILGIAFGVYWVVHRQSADSKSGQSAPSSSLPSMPSMSSMPGVTGTPYAASPLAPPPVMPEASGQDVGATGRQAMAIVPDLRSLPSGWTTEMGPTTPPDGCEDRSSGMCRMATGAAGAVYRTTSSARAMFSVVTYPGEIAAVGGYRSAVAAVSAEQGTSALQVPSVGDQSTGLARPAGSGKAGQIMLRAGNVVCAVGYQSDSGGPDVAMLTRLATTVVERARQAGRGEQPTARVSG
ncbi:hypothetical protein [Streptomyces orinoci]|uniref:Uncharacterized protein n=1 Tax=Streptomyces orinoci TaxID=67339 RepID=A0ABV3K1D2_STRON|nr:hypothetical protein [Streptomyces orinoci]